MRRLFENVVDLRGRFPQFRAAYGQHLFDNQTLLNNRFELVVYNVYGVHFRIGIRLHRVFGNILGMPVIEPRKNINELRTDRDRTAPEEVAAFAADHDQTERLAAVISYEGLSRANDVGIESAAQTTIGRNDYQQNAFLRTDLEQRMRYVFDADSQIAQNISQLKCVGARTEDTFLGTPQFRRGYGLHGFSDLLRVLDRTDPAPNI